MNLQRGTRLGPYEIDSRVGAGGMGEVYRARDHRLGRNVAIKVLSSEFAGDSSLARRFVREARAISALNHPNICALHDIGSEDGVDFLVMEYCEGKSLAGRLESGRLSIDEALQVGIEIARGVEKAHAAGIIHRDIKPSNVMLTPAGAKVLDFGLAAGPFADTNQTTGNIAERLTSEGQILGTVAYMAPEVLRGEPATERSDVFALGLVLYEAVTGERAFRGPDRASMISQILESDPRPVRELAPDVPAPLERLIRSCLAKDPDRRVQSAHDVRLHLEWIREGSNGAVERSEPASRSRKSRRLLVPVLAAAAVVAAAAAWWTRGPLAPAAVSDAAASTAVRAVIDLRDAPPVGLGGFVTPIGYHSPLLALSHDGTRIVYVGIVNGKPQLVLRRVDSFETQIIEGTEGAHHAFFSPDDRWIAFFATNRIAKVPVAGGAAVTLAEIAEPIRGRWQDGAIYVMAAAGIGVMRVPENGGTPETVVNRLPLVSDVLPGGRHLLTRSFRNGSGDFEDITLLEIANRKLTTLVERGYDARFVAPDHLYFMRSGALHRVKFDLATLRVTGEPALVQGGIANESFWTQGQYAAAADGTIAFIPGVDRSVGELTWVDRAGRAQSIPVPPQHYGVFSLSPDDKKLAAEVSDITDAIAIVDLERVEMRRLAVEGHARRPEWIGNDRLVFSSGVGDAPRKVVTADIEGRSVTPLLQHETDAFNHVTSSPDGTLVVAQITNAEGQKTQLHRIGSKEAPKEIQGGGTSSFSPDGKWIGFITTIPRRGRQVAVAPVTDPAQRIQVSHSGGGEPLWCRRCPELFYRAGDEWFSIDTSGREENRWPQPRRVWKSDFIDTLGRSFDVSSDGQRLLIARHTTTPVVDRIGLIHRWQPPR